MTVGIFHRTHNQTPMFTHDGEVWVPIVSSKYIDCLKSNTLLLKYINFNPRMDG